MSTPGLQALALRLADHDWDVAVEAAQSLERAGQAAIDAILWGSVTRMRGSAGAAPTIWTITPPTPAFRRSGG